MTAKRMTLDEALVHEIEAHYLDIKGKQGHVQIDERGARIGEHEVSHEANIYETLKALRTKVKCSLIKYDY